MGEVRKGKNCGILSSSLIHHPLHTVHLFNMSIFIKAGFFLKSL
jgi:hypothetical protein